MNRYEFKNWINNNIIYLDGATGTNLMKAGMPKGVCPEMWIMENPEAIIKLQRDYVSAGSNIVYAPTFGANRIKLEEYGLQDRIEEINKTLVKLSKEAVGNKALVAGDITMTGQQLYPIGTLKFEELIDVYKEQVALLADAGADLIVVETMMSLQETRAAVIAVKEVSDLPVIATLSFEENGRTLFGSDAKTSAIVLAGLGVDAGGVNCSTGPDKMVPIVEAMRRVVDIPIIAKPNAGLPVVNEAGETVYSLDTAGFAEQMEALVKAGASILGGCCGTSPEYIRAISDKFKDCSKKKTINIEEKYYLTSERHTLGFGLDGRFLVIGERINPTGKKKLQEELRGGSLETVLRMAEEQEEYGADILDVNLGMSGIDEKNMMLRVVTELTQATNLPLSIDSSHVDVVEAALRIYPGRALINSISLEKGKAEKLMPLAKKYGAAFILLPLSDEGLPKSMEEKHEIINTLIAKAKEYGLGEKDIIVDGLVTT
ncbi:MAG: homocysteine S-methyltransferase family protein, partial [Lachnospiraceae bacterium]|nr:homocysteine S-methyltransferase family protein [Lachnospiraceae bacterium]